MFSVRNQKFRTGFKRSGARLLGSLLLFLPLLLSAQTDRWAKKGEEAMLIQDYEKAREYFEWSYKKSNNLDSWGRACDCFRATFDYRKAESCYEKLSAEPGADPVYRYYLAQAMLANGMAPVSEPSSRGMG